MADETTAPVAPQHDSTRDTTTPGALSPDYRHETMAYVIGVAGWLVPGLGHALLKMWGRAAVCFLAVGTRGVLGAGLRGNVFSSRGKDAFGSTCSLADVGTVTIFRCAPLPA